MHLLLENDNAHFLCVFNALNLGRYLLVLFESEIRIENHF
jgi:hypothetical protein